MNQIVAGSPVWALILDGIGCVLLALGLVGYFSPSTALFAPFLHVGQQAGPLMATGVLLMGPFYFFLMRRLLHRRQS